MRIVNRQEFFKLPPETLFSKFKPNYIDELCIKGDNLTEDDFLYQSIQDAIKSDSSEEFNDILDSACVNGTHFEMDFYCQIRDGLFEEDQLFMVWERKDIEQLIRRLTEAYKSNFF